VTGDEACKFCGAPSTRIRRSPLDGEITGTSCDDHMVDLMIECVQPGWIESELARINRALALLVAPTPKGVM